MLAKILAAQGMHYSSHVHGASQSFHFDIRCFILPIAPLSYINSTQESSYHLRANAFLSCTNSNLTVCLERFSTATGDR